MTTTRMPTIPPTRAAIALCMGLTVALSGCGQPTGETPAQIEAKAEAEQKQGGRLRDLFGPQDDGTKLGAVNKYIWNATLEVLAFLPIEAVDPFTGVIVTGLGTPPGGNRAYRATIHITDPALDARSLNLSLMTRRGAVDSDTVRAVEDAILTRARQLRDRDSRI